MWSGSSSAHRPWPWQAAQSTARSAGELFRIFGTSLVDEFAGRGGQQGAAVATGAEASAVGRCLGAERHQGAADKACAAVGVMAQAAAFDHAAPALQRLDQAGVPRSMVRVGELFQGRGDAWQAIEARTALAGGFEGQVA